MSVFLLSRFCNWSKVSKFDIWSEFSYVSHVARANSVNLVTRESWVKEKSTQNFWLHFIFCHIIWLLQWFGPICNFLSVKSRNSRERMLLRSKIRVTTHHQARRHSKSGAENRWSLPPSFLSSLKFGSGGKCWRMGRGKDNALGHTTCPILYTSLCAADIGWWITSANHF